MSWKQWDQGEVVEAGDFQTYIQDQVVQSYSNASERSTTLGTAVSEGMLSYREDANVVEVYDGSQWVGVGAEGDITAVTAGTAITGGGTSGAVTLDVDISAISTAQAGTALVATGEVLDVDVAGLAGTALTTSGASLNVDETAITVAQSQVTDLVSDLADKADNADFTGGTAGYTALSNGTAGLSYQPVSHNYIINGAFDIAQRGDTFTALTDTVYTLDRWRFQDSGGTATITQKELTPGDVEAIGFGDIHYYCEMDVTTGDGNLTLANVIEDVRTLSGQDVTLSFWARGVNPGGGTLYAQILQIFGGGGSSATVVSNSFSLTASWQRYEITLSIPSVSGKTINPGNYIGVYISQPSADASTDAWRLDITGVQLEAGSIATPFKRNANSIQGELAACQRYYQRLVTNTNANHPFAAGFCRSTSEADFVLHFMNEMRANPTISTSGNFRVFAPTSRAVSSFTTTIASKITADIRVSASSLVSGEGCSLTANSDADAYIDLDSEL